jgi:hypothetical protein
MRTPWWWVDRVEACTGIGVALSLASFIVPEGIPRDALVAIAILSGLALTVLVIARIAKGRY